MCSEDASLFLITHLRRQVKVLYFYCGGFKIEVRLSALGDHSFLLLLCTDYRAGTAKIAQWECTLSYCHTVTDFLCQRPLLSRMFHAGLKAILFLFPCSCPSVSLANLSFQVSSPSRPYCISAFSYTFIHTRTLPKHSSHSPLTDPRSMKGHHKYFRVHPPHSGNVR